MCCCCRRRRSLCYPFHNMRVLLRTYWFLVCCAYCPFLGAKVKCASYDLLCLAFPYLSASICVRNKCSRCVECVHKSVSYRDVLISHILLYRLLKHMVLSAFVSFFSLLFVSIIPHIHKHISKSSDTVKRGQRCDSISNCDCVSYTSNEHVYIFRLHFNRND